MPTDPPRRSSDEYRRWNDSRLDDLANDVRGLAPLVKQVGIAETNISEHAKDLDDVRDQIKAVEQRLGLRVDAIATTCEAFHSEYRQDQKQAKTANRQVVMAMIAASATVAAAIIAAIAVILTGGG